MKSSKIFVIFCLLIFSSSLSGNRCVYADDSDMYTIDQKIGQMIAIGFRGLTLDECLWVKEYLQQGKIGGVVLFDYDIIKRSYVRNIANPMQTQALINEIKESAEILPFIMIDQEGGRVSRLNQRHGFPETFSFKELSQIGAAETFNMHVQEMVGTLNEMGVNVNFAPVVDLELNKDNAIISGKQRSFSSDPRVVSELSERYIDIHRKMGILTCLKHFPGHGSSTFDTHETFVDITNTWQDIELEPYIDLIGKGKVDMIMTSHVFHAGFDDKYPATLSRKTLTSVLREKMKYKGVIVSDSLEMRAISQRYSLEQAVYLSVNAGVDILLFGNNALYVPEVPIQIIDIIKSYIAQGLLTEKRIDDSFKRIMALKRKIN